MMTIILGVYAAITGAATLGFIALSLASRSVESEELEPVEEIETARDGRRADFDLRAGD